MSSYSIGDLARSFALNRQSGTTRNALSTLSQELATGLKKDTSAAVKGDMSRLSDWQRQIEIGELRVKTMSEAMAVAEVKTAVFDSLSGQLISLANEVDVSNSSNLANSVGRLSESFDHSFRSVVNQLNTSIGGNYVFSGEASNQRTLATADDILSSARSALAGSVTVSDYFNRLDTWMDDAIGGFEAVAYLGSDENANTVRLSDTEKTYIPGRANDTAMKSIIKNLIAGALANDTTIAMPASNISLIQSSVSGGLRNAESQLTELHASLGRVQEQISNAQSENAAQISVSKVARLDLLSVDPFETATALRQAENQMQMIYELTARTSKMSLLEYLR